MTYPITPNPAIHQYPPGYVPPRPPPSGFLKGLAEQLVEAIFNRLLQLLTGGLLGSSAGTVSALAEGFLQDLFAGNLPGALDNLDGTATVVGNQIIQNLDGTATLLLNQGTTLVNTLIDSLDGTAMSPGTALHNMLQGFGTHASTVQGWGTFIGQTGVQQASQLVSSLAGIIPAALDNLDGTAAILGSQIVHNLDGTATYVAQGAANIHSLIDNLDGTAMSFFHAMSQGLSNTLGGLLNAFTGSPVAGITTSQAQQAQVASAAAALQQRLVTIGNGAEESVDIEFSAYSNGPLPAVFTVVSGSGMSISGGQLISGPGNEVIYYNAAPTLTDYQMISIVAPVNGGGGAMIGRMDVTGTNFIYATWSTSPQRWELTCSNGGIFEFGVYFNDTYSPTATYSLVCGDPSVSDLYKFQILKNGVPLTLTSVLLGDSTQVGQTYYEDKGKVSAVGANERYCGLACSGAGPFKVNSFKFQDTAQSQPSVLVATGEPLSSTTYTDLATTSDEVAVIVGASGKVEVVMSAGFTYVSGSGWLPLVSFAMSGANTQAADDSYAFSGPQLNMAKAPSCGHFLLTDLAPGLTVFKMKYRLSSAGTVSISNRRIGVVAL